MQNTKLYVQVSNLSKENKQKIKEITKQKLEIYQITDENGNLNPVLHNEETHPILLNGEISLISIENNGVSIGDLSNIPSVKKVYADRTQNGQQQKYSFIDDIILKNNKIQIPGTQQIFPYNVPRSGGSRSSGKYGGPC